MLTILSILFTAWLTPALAQDVEPATQPPAAAPIRKSDLPAELRDWADWVLTRNPEHSCALGPAGRSCVWPGGLSVDAQADRAFWQLGVHTDRDVAVPLPGGTGTWPVDVRVDGRAAAVADASGVPTVVLPEGSHTVTARVPWTKRPGSLPVPPAVGAVNLIVDGAHIPFPRIDTDGLRLGAVVEDERDGEHLGIEVSRRIVDGIPLVVETALSLRASGRGREVDLGAVLVPGTRAVALSADLPARFTAEGTLVVQVRPGTYQVRFDAIHDGPAEALRRPAPGGAWPETETWAVSTDDRVRAMNLSGPPGVDPSRTTLPEGWHGLPTFALSNSDTLDFETLRRGDPDPAPNRLSLSRELWLDLDGRGLTARDSFSGQMNRGWRLDIVAPFALGHVATHGEDLVVTASEQGAVGVELREQAVSLTAESRVEGATSAMPAVGWATDVSGLDVQLNLPPGFRLFAALGVDSVQGSMVDPWSLFDLFFVLVLAMATARLMGTPWGAVALVGLALSRHELGAPQWSWAAVLALVAVHRVVTEGWPHTLVRGLRIAAMLLLVAVLVPFSVGHLQTAMFPALADQAPATHVAAVQGRFVDLQDSLDTLPGSHAKPRGKEEEKKYLSLQVDPKAVVQTGPGVPEWTFRSAFLGWSGPVDESHDMRLIVLSPFTNLLLALLRVALLGALAMRLAELSRERWMGTTALVRASGLLLALGWLAPAAMAAPSPQLLNDLEQRLTTPPPCAEECVTVAEAQLSMVDDVLTLTAEVHAQADASWPVPGPTKVFVPARVTVDGQRSAAMARMSDGFLHVRLDEGVHRVVIRGPVPPVDALPLAFGIAPKHLDWSAEGWALDGLRADGTVEASVQLARMIGESSTAQSTENLTPWLEVWRQLDLGLPWRVHTVVRRVGPTDYPVSLKVPLLDDEAVTEGGFEATDGVIAVSLDRDEVEVEWLSTIPTTARLDLRSPTDVPWTEVWTLSCSPLFACSTDGPAPIAHVQEGRWYPTWRVWPGEQLRVDVSRPAGVEGQTTTIDSVTLDLQPGRRTLLAKLELLIRSSQGGRQTLTLPEGAALQSVTLDGAPRPLQLRNGRELPIPLTRGCDEWRSNGNKPGQPTSSTGHPPSTSEVLPSTSGRSFGHRPTGGLPGCRVHGGGPSR